MDPVTLLALANAGIQLSQQLLPLAQQAIAGTPVTAEQQAAVLAAYDSLKTLSEKQFSGPEWVISK